MRFAANVRKGWVVLLPFNKMVASKTWERLCREKGWLQDMGVSTVQGSGWKVMYDQDMPSLKGNTKKEMAYWRNPIPGIADETIRRPPPGGLSVWYFFNQQTYDANLVLSKEEFNVPYLDPDSQIIKVAKSRAFVATRDVQAGEWATWKYNSFDNDNVGEHHYAWGTATPLGGLFPPSVPIAIPVPPIPFAVAVPLTSELPPISFLPGADAELADKEEAGADGLLEMALQTPSLPNMEVVERLVVALEVVGVPPSLQTLDEMEVLRIARDLVLESADDDMPGLVNESCSD